MTKKIKSVLAVVLSLAVIFSCTATAFAKQTDEKTPIILIPGFGQSETKVYDDEGEYLGDISSFDLPGLNVDSIVKSLASPAVLSVLTRSDISLSKAVSEYMRELFKPFLLESDGTPVYNKVIRQFNAPYSELSAQEREIIYSHVALDGLEEYDDVRYYYTYDTFGSIRQAAEGLHDYIHNIVLSQTGAGKVNLVPISQGGTVLIEFLELYPEDRQYIGKIINMIPAFDGSEIVGDVLLDNVNVYDIRALHEEIIPSLLGQTDTAYQISIALRLALSSSVQKKVLKAAIAQAREILAVNSTMMWALCPAEDYEAARDILISDEAHDALRAETDQYAQARKNFPATLSELMNDGVVVHNIVSYDTGYFLSSLFDCKDHNADDLLRPSSPSLGAISADIGKTLGDDYEAAHTYCSDPTHNHISPDNVIDASAGYLPENTWYFKGVSHMSMNGREDIKDFASRLILDDSIVDIYTYPGYSQFIDPKQSIAYSEPSESGELMYYYDENGKYMYCEKITQEQTDRVTIWKVLYKFINSVTRVLDSLTAHFTVG